MPKTKYKFTEKERHVMLHALGEPLFDEKQYRRRHGGKCYRNYYYVMHEKDTVWEGLVEKGFATRASVPKELGRGFDYFCTKKGIIAVTGGKFSEVLR